MSSRFYDFVFYLREYWKHWPPGIVQFYHREDTRTSLVRNREFRVIAVVLHRHSDGVVSSAGDRSLPSFPKEFNFHASVIEERTSISYAVQTVDPSPGASARCSFLSSRRLLSSTSTIYDAAAPLIRCRCTCVHNTLLQFTTITAAPSRQRRQR